MRCLSSTDFPPPLRPMMTVIDPVGTSSDRPRSTDWDPNDFMSDSTRITAASFYRRTSAGGAPAPRRPAARISTSRQDRAPEGIADEGQYRGEDERLCRRARHALGAVADVEPLVRADPRHHDPERDRLPEARHDVGHVDERPHLAEVRAFRQPQEAHADEIAAEDSDHVEDGRHQREGY